VSGAQSSQMEPGVLLNFPLSHGSHSVAPGVLDSPAKHVVQNSLGGLLPLVPAGHATNPDTKEELI